jgi:phosphoribosylaminoimidazole carboxylase PurE protein
MGNENPLVGIVLGSKSDMEQAEKISAILDELSIVHEVTVASAHRTPEDVAAYSTRARTRGIKVIIAVAGLSAALPGTIAAHTILPVIGVPAVSGSLGGMDALLAIAQMPPGVPVATVGINGGRNAALLAARVIAIYDEKVFTALSKWTVKASEKIRLDRTTIEGLPSAPAEAYEI